jgi:hypothetical protein
MVLNLVKGIAGRRVAVDLLAIRACEGQKQGSGLTWLQVKPGGFSVTAPQGTHRVPFRACGGYCVTRCYDLHSAPSEARFSNLHVKRRINRLVRQAKLGASCRVQVPVGRAIRKIVRKG